MIEVRQTDLFAGWLRKLRDEQARARIQIRIRRVSLGNFGDSSHLAKASANCGSITGRATESTFTGLET